MYGTCVVCTLGTVFISQSLSGPCADKGVSSPAICMSSTSTLFAARSAAEGIKDQIPRAMLRKNTTLLKLLDEELIYGERWRCDIHHDYGGSEGSFGLETIALVVSGLGI